MAVVILNEEYEQQTSSSLVSLIQAASWCKATHKCHSTKSKLTKLATPAEKVFQVKPVGWTFLALPIFQWMQSELRISGAILSAGHTYLPSSGLSVWPADWLY